MSRFSLSFRLPYSGVAGLVKLARCVGRRCWPAGGFALWLLGGATAVTAAQSPAGPDDFGPLVKLAPFVVNGQQLSVSIHARSERDRRYAAGFAEEVMKVVAESVTTETGRGLVIIGKKGEPHPFRVFRKFLALADAGKIDATVAAHRPELEASLRRWQDAVEVDSPPAEGGKHQEGGDLEFEKIVNALPLPLAGIGAKFYQLAWAEKFDDAKVEARLRALRAEDLERRDLFARFDWVFYLPPKGAFDKVLDELVAEALKDEETGFFARTMVKGVMLVVKPKIRQAIEAVRHGLLFMTVVQARTHFTQDEVSALTAAYIEESVPGRNHSAGPVHERAVRAVQEQIKRNAEKAKAGVDQPSTPATRPTPAATAESPTEPTASDETSDAEEDSSD